MRWKVRSEMPNSAASAGADLIVVMFALIADGAGSKQHQGGTHALTAAIDDVFRHLADQHDV